MFTGRAVADLEGGGCVGRGAARRALAVRRAVVAVRRAEQLQRLHALRGGKKQRGDHGHRVRGQSIFAAWAVADLRGEGAAEGQSGGRVVLDDGHVLALGQEVDDAHLQRGASRVRLQAAARKGKRQWNAASDRDTARKRHSFRHGGRPRGNGSGVLSVSLSLTWHFEVQLQQGFSIGIAAVSHLALGSAHGRAVPADGRGERLLVGLTPPPRNPHSTCHPAVGRCFA